MRLATSVAIALSLVAGQALAQTPPPAVDAAFQAILANPKVIKALDDIKADDARALEEQKRITEIPAPPYKEKIRAEYFLNRMQELGFKDAAIDSEGNGDCAAQGHRRRTSQTGGIGASRHGVSRRH